MEALHSSSFTQPAQFICCGGGVEVCMVYMAYFMSGSHRVEGRWLIGVWGGDAEQLMVSNFLPTYGSHGAQARVNSETGPICDEK